MLYKVYNKCMQHIYVFYEIYSYNFIHQLLELLNRYLSQNIEEVKEEETTNNRQPGNIIILMGFHPVDGCFQELQPTWERSINWICTI